MTVALGWAAVAGCDGVRGGGGGGGGFTGPATSAPGTERDQGSFEGWQPRSEASIEGVPGLEPSEGEITRSDDLSPGLEAALAQCPKLLADAEKKAVLSCQPGSTHATALAWAAPWFSQQVAIDPRLAGLDWLPVMNVAPSFQPDDGNIDVYECQTNPIAPGAGPGASMNAFAMLNAIWMLDPLMDAMTEAAATYDLLREQFGGSFSTSEAELALGNTIAGIYASHTNGQGWASVDPGTAWERISSSPSAMQAYLGQVSFVFFHELGHANLGHAPIKCLVQAQLSEAQRNELKPELMKLFRSTEAQADIYSATILKSIGFGPEGPLLVVLGFIGMNSTGCLVDGAPADPTDCLLGKGLLLSHPPNDERALIIKKIMVDGEDLTGLLEAEKLAEVRDQQCGNGVCGSSESTESCPQDCAPDDPVDGGGENEEDVGWGAEPGLSCWEILDCLVACDSDEVCGESCVQDASRTGIGLLDMLLTCVDDSGCGDDDACIEAVCGNEFDACFAD